MSATAPPSSPTDLPVAGNTPHTSPENRQFYPALDGIRALAFLMVFFHHYLSVPWGWTGVDLFFVLSGFLITGILFDTRNDPHRVSTFYIRRTLRIFPLYYAVLLVIFAAPGFIHWPSSLIWLGWPLYMGNYLRFLHPYVAGDVLQRLADFQPTVHLGHTFAPLYLGHFWSLCVEEQFYLVWPWIVFGVRRRRTLLWICGLSLPICLALRIVGAHSLPSWMLDGEILYRTTPFRLDALLLGGMIALLLRGRFRDRLLRVSRQVLPFVMVPAFLGIAYGWSVFIRHRAYTLPDWKFTWGLSVFDLLAAVLILAALQPGSFVYRIFSVRPLRTLGRISYGAYVLHDIPHVLYQGIAKHLVEGTVLGRHTAESVARLEITLLTALIGLSATIALAWLSFRFFESPFLELKKRWSVRVLDSSYAVASDR